MRPELDHVDYAKWIDDPELEAQLLTYGMDDQWEHLSGSDVNQDGIVVSPYGKTLNELIAVARKAGLPGFAAKQIADWLYKKEIQAIDEMTNLTKKTRQREGL